MIDILLYFSHIKNRPIPKRLRYAKILFPNYSILICFQFHFGPDRRHRGFGQWHIRYYPGHIPNHPWCHLFSGFPVQCRTLFRRERRPEKRDNPSFGLCSYCRGRCGHLYLPHRNCGVRWRSTRSIEISASGPWSWACPSPSLPWWRYPSSVPCSLQYSLSVLVSSLPCCCSMPFCSGHWRSGPKTRDYLPFKRSFPLPSATKD